ncbi:MAG: hypothetical protein HZY76_01865 [Anaerolineae bacterium]|nr:MAG: hypothetical protein HZY76_01865 [Anaerolineae bacterium]
MSQIPQIKRLDDATAKVNTAVKQENGTAVIRHTASLQPILAELNDAPAVRIAASSRLAQVVADDPRRSRSWFPNC